MNSVYYLRTNNGLDVIRIAHDGLTVEANYFAHSEWSLETSLLPVRTRDAVHRFCSEQGIPLPDWSVMAMRPF